MRKLLGMACLAAVVAMAAPTGVWADDDDDDDDGDVTICNSNIGQGPFDNVIAVPGGRCVLKEATVEGNVKAEAGSELDISNETTVAGNVRGNPGSSVFVSGGMVAGDVECKGAVPGSSFIACSIDRVSIAGDVRVTDADAEGGFLSITANTIFGDVEVFDNTATGIGIGNNEIFGDLKCEGNVPDPVLGTENLVPFGDRKGQCKEM